MKKVLLVGSTGFLGAYLSDRFELLYDVERGSRSTGVDLTDDLCTDNFASYDVIVNCAAMLSDREEDIDQLVQVNGAGPVKLAKIAERCNAHFIQISTLSVIDHPSNEYHGFYGISKFLGEQLLNQFCSSNNVNLTILRLPAIIDVEGKASSAQPMFYRILDQVEQTGEITVYGKIDPDRNFISTRDTEEILRKVISERRVGTWNCVHPHSMSIAGIAQLAAQVLQKDVEIAFDHDKPNLKTICIPGDAHICSEGEQIEFESLASIIRGYYERKA